MRPLVEVQLQDPRWGRLGALADRALSGVLAQLGLEGPFEVSLLGCDDAEIARLNADFRGKPVATNVLSWPAEERGAQARGATPDLPDPANPMDLELGDVAISYDTCAREAEAQGKDFETHVCHLLVHGILHLFGFDHQNDADAALMEGLEVKTLAQLGVANPYEKDYRAPDA